jgi:hypothetical protein
VIENDISTVGETSFCVGAIPASGHCRLTTATRPGSGAAGCGSNQLRQPGYCGERADTVGDATDRTDDLPQTESPPGPGANVGLHFVYEGIDGRCRRGLATVNPA